MKAAFCMMFKSNWLLIIRWQKLESKNLREFRYTKDQLNDGDFVF